MATRAKKRARKTARQATKTKVKAKAKAKTNKMAMKRTAKRAKVQGEGNYEASRRYRQRLERFVATNDVGDTARRAAPRSRAEAESLRAAEAAGRRRAKGEDPAFRRRAAPRVESSTRARASRH